MTETAVLEQEQAADPLDDMIGGLEAILGQLRQARSHGGSSLMLRFRAAGVRKAAGVLDGLRDALAREALECDGEAAAIVAAEEAKEALEQAADAVQAAEASFAATSEPEQAAAKTATTARQLAEAARDALAQAERDDAEPADLHGRARDTAAVLEHEARKLAGVQAERQSAREALDRARDAHRSAQDALRAAEEAAAHPGPASLSPGDLAKAYMFDFPRRAFDGEQKTPEEWAAIKWNASKTCDALKVIPTGAEALVTEQIARRAFTATRGGGTVQFQVDGHLVTLARVPGVPSGSTVLATVAQGR